MFSGQKSGLSENGIAQIQKKSRIFVEYGYYLSACKPRLPGPPNTAKGLRSIVNHHGKRKVI
jgi:hypothetical protein